MNQEATRDRSVDAKEPVTFLNGNGKIRRRLVLRLVILPIVLCCALFLTSGNLKWWQGWAYLLVVTVPLEAMFVRLAIHDPKLLERRLQGKEELGEQQRLIRWLKPLFEIGFLLPGFDYRFGWSRALVGEAPVWLNLLADALILAGLLCIVWVLEVNSFASRTIRVEESQTVVSTGPYGIVRHPMYTGSIVLWIGTPLALGSWIALPFAVLIAPFYVVRLLNEEKLLLVQLPGYAEYCRKTRWRLFPFVW